MIKIYDILVCFFFGIVLGSILSGSKTFMFVGLIGMFIFMLIGIANENKT